MRIDWAIACRYCEVANNEVSMIGGNADVFTVPGLPAPIGVWVALHVVTPEYETGPENPHVYRSHVLDPAMEPIPESEMEIPDVISPPSPVPGRETEEVVSTYHRFLAETEGTYTIEMRVDERTKAIPITVRLIDSAPPAPTSPDPGD